jgi:hypothetical protein
MPSSEMLRRIDPVRNDVSEELNASIIRLARIDELGTLAVTSNVPSSPILVTLMVEAIRFSETYRFIQETHEVTPQKTAFFIIVIVVTFTRHYIQDVSTLSFCLLP